MLRVRLLPGHFKADQSDKGRAGVRQIVYCVGSNGNGAAYDSCNKFTDKKQYIQPDPYRAAEHAVGLPDLRRRSILVILYEYSGKKRHHEKHLRFGH